MITRRAFLRSTASALTLSTLAYPRFSLAQSVGSGKNLIVITLAGGVDILTMCPLYNSLYGLVADARVNLKVPLASIDPLSSEVGLHSNLNALYQAAHTNRQNLKVIQSLGFPAPSRSHNDAQTFYATMARNSDGTAAKEGWIARATKNSANNFGIYHVWGLATNNSLEFNPPGSIPAILVENLNAFEYSEISNTNNPLLSSSEQAAVRDTTRALLQIPQASKSSEKVRQGMKLVDPALSRIRTISQVALNGDYGPTPLNSFATRVQDAVRIIIDGARDPGINSIINIKFDGFDTHGNQSAVLLPKLTILGNALAGAISDLDNAGMWNDTAILVVTEFGRTVFEHGSSSDAGTDHGLASSIIALGGAVNGGADAVWGPLPSQADLTNRSKNVITPQSDPRSVFAEVFDWMSLDTEELLSEEFLRDDIGLFLT